MTTPGSLSPPPGPNGAGPGGRAAGLVPELRAPPDPLERQVKRVTWLIAVVALGAGTAFLPIGLAAGLSITAAVSFAIGLLVANVPEGLLPTITLALAVGVREMAGRVPSSSGCRRSRRSARPRSSAPTRPAP